MVMGVGAYRKLEKEVEEEERGTGRIMSTERAKVDPKARLTIVLSQPGLTKWQD